MGDVGLVAEPLIGVEGALVVAFGLVVVPAVLGEDAEPVVDEGHAGPGDPFADVQGALVVAFGLVVIPGAARHQAELAEPAGLVGGSVGQPGQGVVDEGGFLVPSSPGVQLLANRPGDLGGVAGVPGGQQVVAGFQQVMHVGGLVVAIPGPATASRRRSAGTRRPVPGRAGGGQLGGGPSVHEEPRPRRFLVTVTSPAAWHAPTCPVSPGLARTGGTGSRSSSIRYGSSSARTSSGSTGQVDRPARGDPGRGQDLADPLVGGGSVRDVRGGRVGLPGGEQYRVVVDGFAVDRDSLSAGRRRR